MRSPFLRRFGMPSPFFDNETGFSPAALFALAEPGIWLDPSDLSTMFQDRAGTTAVTTPGQTVGLRLDKSKGLVLGSELFADQTPTIDNALGSVGAYNPATRTMTNTGSVVAGYPRFQFDLGLVVGRTYMVSGTLSGSISQVGPVRLSNTGTANTVPYSTTTGVFFGRVVAAASFIEFGTQLDGAEAVAISALSVREIAGNHALATADLNRGTYGIEPLGGTRNLLTWTEQFDNAAWLKTRSSISANVASAPDGTNTADKIVEDTSTNSHFIAQSVSVAANASMAISIYAKPSGRDFLAIATQDQAGTFRTSYFNLSSGTVGTVAAGQTASILSSGDGWYRCTVVQSQSATSGTFTFYPSPAAVNGSASYTGDGTSGILVWGAQLELGTSATAYQRVVDQYNVTQAGVPTLHYVQYDGSNDTYLTPTITPGTDKVQVFTGIRKLSDATRAVFMEWSTTSANNGTFAVEAPAVAAEPRFTFFSRGTLAVSPGVNNAIYAAPNTRVLTGLADISGDVATMRLNGTQVNQSTGDQGTGNYLAYPLYIGRRNDASFPFNGRDYGIIVRFGANLTATQIADTEGWMNQRTGAY